MPDMTALNKWMNKKRGRQSRLAEALGITKSAVSQWDEVPIDRVPEVSDLTGIPREKLRPDFYRMRRNGDTPILD